MKGMILIVAIFCCIYGNALAALKSKGKKDCTQEPRDIFLLVDGSASLGYSQFESVRRFIIQLIKAITVHEKYTHFGLLQFSSDDKTKIEFGLDYSHNSDVLLRKVRSLKYQSGRATKTGSALEIVERQVFTPEADDRPEVPDYLIIFTDGQATDRTRAYRNAEKLKKRGVKIVAIGAGREKLNFLKQLEEIASSPSDVWMADFNNLNEIAGVIAQDVVNEVCPQPPPDRTKAICSQEPRDVFLVVDGSLSIGTTQFEKIRKFLTELVQTLVVNPNMTHFGLLQFSSLKKTRIEFSLDYSHREATLLNRIKYLRYQKGSSTYTGNALKIAEQQVFTVEGDDRPEVDDILIVFTDGATRDQRVAVRHADLMKARNVHIIGIAAGPKRHEFKHQVEAIASSPEDVYMVEFDGLEGVLYRLVNNVCKAPPTTIPPTTTPEPTTTPLPTTTPEPTTTPKPTTTPPPPICHDQMKRDVLFLLDLPRQVRYKRFLMIKKYLKKLVRHMPIEDGRFMVGIMQAGDALQPGMYVNFSKHLQKNMLLYKINRMKRAGAKYSFNIAAYREAGYKFHKMNYMYGRSNVEDVLILVTTRSLRERPYWDSDLERAKDEVLTFRQMGVQVLTIALGRERYRISMQMQQMASHREPIILSSYKNLVREESKVLEVMKAVCPSVDGVPATQFPAPECRRTPHDIFFVVDGSASIKSENFRHVRKFLMDLFMLLRVGISDIHIGMLQFSQVHKTEFLLNMDKYSAEEQMRVVDNMEYQSGRRTMTGDALTRVANKVFTGNPLDGDRPGVKDVLLIFTDGNAHDLRIALEQAEIIKSRGVRVITIGAGVRRNVRRFENELKQMCTDPDEYFLMVDFENLSGFANEAFPLICKPLKKKKL